MFGDLIQLFEQLGPRRCAEKSIFFMRWDRRLANFLQSETSIALYSFLRNYIYGVVFNAKRPIFRDPEIREL